MAHYPREPLVDTPADDEMTAHVALIQWARWCLQRRRPGRALSAEGRYRPESGHVHEGLVARQQVDVLTAEAVNQALLRLPEQHREILRLRYHVEMPDLAIAKSLGIKRSGFQKFIRDARLMLAAVLRQAEARR